MRKGAHLIFSSQVKNVVVLRTLDLGLCYKLRTQFWTASAAPASVWEMILMHQITIIYSTALEYYFNGFMLWT